MQRRFIQERFNKDTPFYTPESSIINLINENDGDFQQVTSENELTNTITITLSQEQESIDLKNNEIIVADQNKRTQYCDDNAISWSIEEE